MGHVIHMNKLRYTNERVITHKYPHSSLSAAWATSAHLNESCHAHEWVLTHIWMSHVTHTNESCRTYEWVMTHTWVSRVTHMNESCHTCDGVMSHIRMSHDTQTSTSKSQHGANNMSHTRMSHATCLYKHQASCHTYERVIALVCRLHVWYMNASWYIRVTWKRHVTQMSESCQVTWLIHMCDMTYSNMVYTGELTHSFNGLILWTSSPIHLMGSFYERADSFI